MPGKKTAAKPAKAKKPAPAAVRKAAPAKAAAPSKAAPLARMGSAEKPRPASAAVTRKAPVSANPIRTASPASSKSSPKSPSSKPPSLNSPSLNLIDTGPVATFVQRNPIVQPDAADADDGDDSNLLSGPRNVSPYIAKRGEQYMNREQLEHFRLILVSWKRDLMEEVDRTVSHMKDEAANFPDPNDRATQEEEFSLELRTRDRERKLIRKIEEAVKRIDDGSYGYCLETGEEIGIKRLEARPVATLSIEAQERRERRERQYGDRDDRYR